MSQRSLPRVYIGTLLILISSVTTGRSTAQVFHMYLTRPPGVDVQVWWTPTSSHGGHHVWRAPCVLCLHVWEDACMTNPGMRTAMSKVMYT